ncbi:MAG: hypothetical protein ACRDZM_02870, partial [Acidimicrobiia bacterium]
MRRLLLSVLAIFLMAPSLAFGQSEGERRLDVIDISGPLDDQAVAFISDTILEVAERGAEVVVIQLDSPGVVADEDIWNELVELVAAPPVPVVAWIGPAPAVAYGGALGLAVVAQATLAAPGVEIGYAQPGFIGRGDEAAAQATTLADTVLTVSEPVEGMIDDVAPSIQQLIA